jgi:hypothetical protein
MYTSIMKNQKFGVSHGEAAGFFRQLIVNVDVDNQYIVMSAVWTLTTPFP